jgi:hypothetical protein
MRNLNAIELNQVNGAGLGDITLADMGQKLRDNGPAIVATLTLLAIGVTATYFGTCRYHGIGKTPAPTLPAQVPPQVPPVPAT